MEITSACFTYQYLDANGLTATQRAEVELGHTDSRTLDGKVRVDVYYEVLCPDSRNFILRQLFPAWEQISDAFFINYIPYGKAKTYYDAREDDYSFKCQHGPKECQGNIYHACSSHYIRNETLKLDFIRCMMLNNYSPRGAVMRCGRQYETTVDIEPILACGSGREGRRLHAHAAKLNQQLSPRMTFVPTVLLNGKHGNQRSILRYLKQEICQRYEGDAVVKSCQSYT